MPFNSITITFGGLCLLVAERDPENASRIMAVHGMIPPTGSGPHDGCGTRVDQHLARMYYDKAHDGGTDLTGDPNEIHLEHTLITIPAFGSTTTLQLPPAEVAKAGEPGAREVPGKLLGLDTKGRVLSRISLTAGEVSIPNDGSDGVCWDYGGSI